MKCNKCKRSDLILSDFVFKNKEKGILHTICKDCQKAYKLKHYYANKQEHYDRNEKTRLVLKEYANKIKSIGCLKCDEKELCCLDFHHLRNKDMAVANLINRGSLKRLVKEIDKCVILCSNCHRKFHNGILKL